MNEFCENCDCDECFYQQNPDSLSKQIETAMTRATGLEFNIELYLLGDDSLEELLRFIETMEAKTRRRGGDEPPSGFVM